MAIVRVGGTHHRGTFDSVRWTRGGFELEDDAGRQKESSVLKGPSGWRRADE
jgi:hypothetical protein